MQAGSSPRGRGKRQIDTPASRRRGLIPARAGKTCRCRHPHRAAPAHPRAGGENPGAWWLPVVAGGSSPRGRGKPSVSGDGHFLSGSSPRGRGKLANAVPGASGKRLIPARAGKTGPRAGQRSREAAHPRAGGENKPSGALANIAYGSSPRGRGKRGAVVVSQSRNAAHPRAGGENLINAGVEVLNAGSSPRGRGKRKSRRCGRRRRLIPARAGKTGSRAFRRRPSTAHPRAGGENGARTDLSSPSTGSSPRGRGKLGEWSAQWLSSRLIPARAGKTRTCRPELTSRAAHPRAGGENFARYSRRVIAPGSSPRGRGKQRLKRKCKTPFRLIPARAGKTHPEQPADPCAPAHPRAGGENAPGNGGAHAGLGSSPRGRGKLGILTAWERRLGLIPARAGKTWGL